MRKTALAVVIAVSAAWAPAVWARDPGPIDVRGRDAAVSRGRGASNAPATARQPGYNPAALEFDGIHGPRAGGREPRRQQQPRRRLYEEVEEGIDRGNGRIEDEQSYQLRRLREDRDERLGRTPRPREAERFQEEYDRRRRTEQRRERQQSVERGRRVDDPAAESTVRQPTALEQSPGPGGSALSRFVAEQEALLTGARERYQRDLAGAEAERDAAIEAAGSREARAAARRRFDERRAELTRRYQQYRREILGNR